MGSWDFASTTTTRTPISSTNADGNRRENLVFSAKPKPGSYLVYARLFDACGAAPVHFHFAVVEPDGANGNDPTVTLARDGWLTSFDAHGGADIGTFVAEVAF